MAPKPKSTPSTSLKPPKLCPKCGSYICISTTSPTKSCNEYEILFAYEAQPRVPLLPLPSQGRIPDIKDRIKPHSSASFLTSRTRTSNLFADEEDESEVETEEDRKKREHERKEGDEKTRDEISKALGEDIGPESFPRDHRERSSGARTADEGFHSDEDSPDFEEIHIKERQEELRWSILVRRRLKHGGVPSLGGSI